MMNKKKREKTTIFSFAGEGEKEITWNSVINPKKTVVAVCSFYTDLSQMLVNSILNGVTKKSVVSVRAECAECEISCFSYFSFG